MAKCMNKLFRRHIPRVVVIAATVVFLLSIGTVIKKSISDELSTSVRELWRPTYNLSEDALRICFPQWWSISLPPDLTLYSQNTKWFPPSVLSKRQRYITECVPEGLPELGRYLARWLDKVAGVCAIGMQLEEVVQRVVTVSIFQ